MAHSVFRIYTNLIRPVEALDKLPKGKKMLLYDSTEFFLIAVMNKQPRVDAPIHIC